MYVPKKFRVEDEKRLHDFIEDHSFGILFSSHDGAPCATHLPFLLNREHGFLYGHLARGNPQWKDVVGQEVLVVFHGPHRYISASWYETKHSVPTWNYVAVHVYGTIELIDNRDQLLSDLNDMVAKYEGQEAAYRIEPDNIDYVHGLMNGIIGFKLNISRIEGKWKLSQNHSQERRERVISKLEELGDHQAMEMAGLMREEGFRNE